MIIGISGKKQSGKDTIALIMQAIWCYYEEDSNQNFLQFVNVFIRSKDLLNDLGVIPTSKIDYFSKRMKKALAGIFGLDANLFDQNDFKSSNSFISKSEDGSKYTWREILQIFGTSVGRNINPDFWITALFNDVQYRFIKLKLIISDVRFVNEAQSIKARNGF